MNLFKIDISSRHKKCIVLVVLIVFGVIVSIGWLTPALLVLLWTVLLSTYYFIHQHTENRFSQQQIGNIQQRMEIILETTKTCLDIIDAQFNLRYVDKGWQKIYGPYEGRKCYEYFMDRGEPCSYCGLPLALKTQKPVITEKYLVKEHRYIQITTLPFQENNGEWLVSEVKVDITDRKQTEIEREDLLVQMKNAVKDANRNRSQLEAVFQAMQDGLVVFDMQGNVVLVNEAEVKITNFARAEEIKRDLTFFAGIFELTELNGQLLPFENWPVMRIMRGESLDNWELRGRRKDTGQEWFFSYSGGPVYDEDGQQILAVTITRDITTHKQAEKDRLLQIQRMEALLSLNRITDLPLNEIIATTVENSIRLTGSTIGYLATLNEDESVMTIQYWSQSAHEACKVVDKPIVYPVENTGLWGEAVRQRQPVITNDYSASNPHKQGIPDGHVPVIRHMNIPVFDGDRIVAVAGVGNKSTDYDERDVNQFQLLMDGCWQIITRRRIQEELRKSEEDLHITLKSIGDGVISTDREERIVQMNPMAEILTGWNSSEALGRPLDEVFQIMDAKTRQKIQTPTAHVLATGKVVTLSNHTILISRDGTERHIADSAAPIQNREGIITGMVLVFSDMTQEYVAREELRKSESLYKSLVENINMGVTLIDSEYRILKVNTGFAKMFNKNAEEFIGKECFREFEKRDKICPHCPGSLAMASGLPAETETEGIRDDGNSFTVRLQAFPVLNQEGRATSYIEVVEDITERKQAEAKHEKRVQQRQGISLLQYSLLAPGSLEEKLRHITDEIVRLFDADFCRVWLIRPGDLCGSGCIHAETQEGPHVCRTPEKCLHLIASSGRYTHIDGEAHRRVPFGCYKIGKIAKDEDHKFLTNDVQHDPRVHNHEWACDLGLVSFAGYQLRPEGGDPLGVFALFAKHPITPDEVTLLDGLSSTIALVIQQDAIEEILREEQKNLHTLFEAAPVGMVLLDENRIIKNINQTMSNLVGREIESMLDVPLGMAMNCKNMASDHLQSCGQTDGCSLCPLHSVITRVLHKGENVHGEEIQLHLSDLANASYIWLHIGAERITLRGQQHIILTMNDLTSRKKIESQLRQDEKMRTIGQLAAGIAHEINTPTQYINDNLHFLHDGFQDIIQLLDRYAQWAKAEKEGNLPNETHPSLEDLIQKINLSYLMEEIPGAIQQSMEGASNIGRIVQAMKQFSHPGSKEKQLVNIEQIINNTIAITRNLWKYVTEITTDFGPETPLVPCMAEKMQQVFLNLIVNAKDAIEEKFSRESGEKGLIHITARKKEEVLEIRIADNGPGIPPSIREHIFEPFFTTKEVGKGSGQGLAICHSILVEEHQGCIEVETEEGKGTTFILCLPLEVALSDAY